jgi:hypothetical protein
VRLTSQGLCAGPKWLCSFDEPIANSSMLALPISTPPAPSMRSWMVAL